jgi:hypothetical protein
MDDFSKPMKIEVQGCEYIEATELTPCREEATVSWSGETGRR